MQLTCSEAINQRLTEDIQRLNQQFIREAIRVWDAGQVSGIAFCCWVHLSVYQLWREMAASR